MAADLPSHIGRYEVVSRLGQGGMGSLYLAKDPKIGRLVAIKLVRQEFDSPEARQRFAREAQSAGTLRHPNIVTIFDVDEHEGLPFIAMEYIDGETLGEIVKRKALLPLTRRLKWMEDLCSGLAYAHRQGVIHRDVKPANLMVDTEGTLKILDFGLARREASKFTQSHVLVGTPNYMSPEQIRGDNLDPRSDIFSVGVVLYEVVTYREAFAGAVHQAMHKILHEEPEPVEDVVPGVDRALSKAISRALQKDRHGRYQDLTALKNDLSEVRQRMETAAADVGATTPLSRDARFQTGEAGATQQKTVPISSRASGASKRVGTQRQSLQRRRAEQITAFLDDARAKFEAGELEKAREACEQALLFDPDHPGGLQLLDDIAGEMDRRQVAQWIAQARAELQKGQLDAAEALLAQARQLQPESGDVQQLQEAIDTTRREIERTRQIQEAMRRARARFAEGSFDAAIRAAGEALAIDAEHAAAKDLIARAQEAIEAQKTRAERDAAAQAAVSAARAQFERGDKDGAVKALEAFSPPHDLVSAFLATLKGEAAPELAEPLVSEGPAARPGRGGETAHILRTSRGPTPDLPARRNFLIAAAVFSVVVVSATVYFRPWELGQPAAETTTATDTASNASAPAPEPAVPTPAPIAPPAALQAPATDENGRDLREAYRLLVGGQRAQAEAIAARIRRRDAQFARGQDFKDLLAAIDTTKANEEKQKLAEAAAAAARAVPTPAPAAEKPVLKDPENPPAGAAGAPITVLPGGGFAATSEPPSPLLLGQVERPAIEKVVQQWAAAFARLDVKALSEIRALSPDEAKRWQNTFSNMASYKLNVRLVGDPQVIDTEAIVPVEEIAVYTAKRGGGISITQQPFKTSYRLRKIGSEWRLLVPSTPMPAKPGQ
jgi:tetratricopeptide (TPR) repeat protein/predicted Ser/Thr protein kinase